MRELVLNNCRIDKRYDIRSELGRGSYAEIFLANDNLASPQSPHSSVVIKALNVFLQDDLDADLERTLVENFQNEAIALDRVRHPNIISRLGHGTARDLKGMVFHYLILEYLSGGDLQNAVRKREIPLIQALSYIEQICAGLGHAHKNGIIHRDIKPQNLLLTGDLATVKIADFGVARFSMADSPITRVGTNVYAPPEHSPVFAGQTGGLGVAKLTPAADIYSLAKSVYTLITRESPRAYANRPIDDLPPAFRYEEWADDLIRVLKRATRSEPGKRPQSVDDFWGDLDVVRRLGADEEIGTVIKSRAVEPQAHVARGYTPIVPGQPHFEPASDPAFKLDSPLEQIASMANSPVAHSPYAPKGNFAVGANLHTRTQLKRKRTFRRFSAFAIFIIAFSGILYGAASYMRGAGILPEMFSSIKTKTGVANTDIFLRSGPNADNDKIGLVTKNSKVKIVKVQNNWYQVDVVEQGRIRNPIDPTTRGWLNGKYLDVDNN